VYKFKFNAVRRAFLVHSSAFSQHLKDRFLNLRTTLSITETPTEESRVFFNAGDFQVNIVLLKSAGPILALNDGSSSLPYPWPSFPISGHLHRVATSFAPVVRKGRAHHRGREPRRRYALKSRQSE
jgi:hypothetical protein